MEVKTLVEIALTSPDLNTAVGALTRARQMQPSGRLEVAGVEIKDWDTFREERREKIKQRLYAGQLIGDVPKVGDLANEFKCSYSLICRVRKEWMDEQKESEKQSAA